MHRFSPGQRLLEILRDVRLSIRALIARPLFTLTTVITQTAGTILVMWLGEKITEHGIGNGISLIIFVNIIGRVPNTIAQAYDSFRGGALSLLTILVVLTIMVVVIAAVVLMTQGMRKIPVQYAKRIVGRRMYGGAATHIPLRVTTAPESSTRSRQAWSGGAGRRWPPRHGRQCATPAVNHPGPPVRPAAVRSRDRARRRAAGPFVSSRIARGRADRLRGRA